MAPYLELYRHTVSAAVALSRAQTALSLQMAFSDYNVLLQIIKYHIVLVIVYQVDLIVTYKVLLTDFF